MLQLVERACRAVAVAYACAVLVVLAVLAPSPASAQAPGATPGANSPPAYIGRWYVQSPDVCKRPPGGAEGLITITAQEFIGRENRCKITRAIPRGTRTDLTVQCRGEGEVSTERETVEVVDGQLLRTVSVEGKPATFRYRRCP